LVILLIVVFVLAYNLDAQLKNQVQKKMSVEERIQMPSIMNGSYSIFSPERFHMSQSYSLSYFSMGGLTGSIGMYENRMSFLLSDKLLLNTKIGFIYSPFNQIGIQNNLWNNLIYGAELIYRPTRNTILNLRFDKEPYYYYPRYYYLHR